MRWTFGLMVALALLTGVPATAQGDDFVREMRRFADITAGQATGSATPVDKLLSFGRRDGTTIVTSIGIARPHEWPDFGQGAVAVMRTRTSGADDNRIPPPDDFDFVRRTGMRLFVVGEWSEPAAMWEIAREDGGEMRFRQIGPDGVAAAWRVPGQRASAAH